MDTPKSLMKAVVRAFYETKHILVIDALMIHHALRDDELAKLLGLQTKDLHKLCGKLTEDRMMAVHARLEQREGQARPVTRTWYWLDYRAAIDGIKWRMKKTIDQVEIKMNQDADTKGYVCPRCHKRSSILDALTFDIDVSGMWKCDRCSTVLIEDDESTEVKQHQERLSRFMNQAKLLVNMLQKVDEVAIPENDFDKALSIAVPVPQDKSRIDQHVPVEFKSKKGSTTTVAAPSLDVQITDSSKKTAAEITAEQARKQQQAEKNALPVWHTQSTVEPGAITNAGAKEATERAARESDTAGLHLKQEEVSAENAVVDSNEAAIAAFYREQQENLRLTDEEEDSDDEDAEFEDLDVGNGGSAVDSSAATPVALSGKATGTTIGGIGIGESEEDDEGSRVAKRLKLQSPAEDSEEDMEFEDV